MYGQQGASALIPWTFLFGPFWRGESQLPLTLFSTLEIKTTEEMRNNSTTTNTACTTCNAFTHRLEAVVCNKGGYI